MATSTGIANPPFPLLPLRAVEDYPTTTITYESWMPPPVPNPLGMTGRWTKDKIVLPTCSSIAAKEQVIHCISHFKQFIDRYNVTSGPMVFDYFYRVINGDVMTNWNQRTHGIDLTVANFDTHLTALISQIFSPTAFIEQDTYLRVSTKPYKMSCNELLSRLRLISHYMRLLPGVPHPGTPPYDDNSLKPIYYSLMLDIWQEQFDKSGNELSSPDYTLEMLVAYMTRLETIFNKKRRTNTHHSGSPQTHIGFRRHGHHYTNHRHRLSHPGFGQGGRGQSRPHHPNHGSRYDTPYTSPRHHHHHNLSFPSRPPVSQQPPRPRFQPHGGFPHRGGRNTPAFQSPPRLHGRGNPAGRFQPRRQDNYLADTSSPHDLSYSTYDNTITDTSPNDPTYSHTNSTNTTTHDLHYHEESHVDDSTLPTEDLHYHDDWNNDHTYDMYSTTDAYPSNGDY